MPCKKQLEMSIVELLYEQKLVSEEEYIHLKMMIQEEHDYDEGRHL